MLRADRFSIQMLRGPDQRTDGTYMRLLAFPKLDPGQPVEWALKPEPTVR